MAEMENHNGSRAARRLKYAAIILGVILVVLIIFLVFNYMALRRTQIIHDHRSFLNLLASHGPLTANDVDIIHPWMTFNYLNKVFNLPPDYLKGHLGIADTRYPELTISGYAKTAHLDLTVFLNGVTNAVRTALTTSTAATSTAK